MTILDEDIQSIANMMNEARQLRDTSILITGATGLIGSLLTKGIMRANQQHSTKIKLIILIRNKDKAIRMFSRYDDYKNVDVIVGDIINMPEITSAIDYIFHCASVTTSSEMVEHPVRTIETIIDGTKNILSLALKKGTKSLVYLSSMEVYGQVPNNGLRTSEEELGFINVLNSRSSYPESKRMAECLCYAYFKEFHVPVKIARLAQTFGPGIAKNDKRVFAQFAKSVIANKDIVLHTYGNSIGNYCYTTDCIDGLITILLKGNDGEAYNVVNEDSTMSIKDVANLVLNEFPDSNISVKIEILDKTCYAADTFLRLDGSKLNRLGWNASISLENSYIRLIQFMKENEW